MSVLHFKSRPWTVFDAANKEHRRWYNPYRFIVPEDHGDLITMCQRALVRYYVAHEFDKKPRQTVRFQQRR